MVVVASDDEIGLNVAIDSSTLMMIEAAVVEEVVEVMVMKTTSLTLVAAGIHYLVFACAVVPRQKGKLMPWGG